MIDIHCHILHGVDDGAADLQESIEMARLAYEDGIRHIIATPHLNANYDNFGDIVVTKTKQLQKTLDRLNIGVKLYPGNEVRIDEATQVIEYAKNDRFCYLGPKNKFILLEQRWLNYNEDTLEVITWFLQRGIIPIVPHPERHHFFRESPELLIRLIEAGAWTQVSVDSLLGKNSFEAQIFGEWMIERDYVHTIATDAHNVNRKPNMADGYRIVRKLAGDRFADDIHNRLKQIISDLE